ncbi:OmpA family protein [Variovorax fucosicus]|uniref:OmpA family protein n=1 Tax=Variovorax fucosicus TaxID=3053517 RepID=UPI00257844BB|nr:OmpA family protein [Variovorax sp. J22G47]MDM0054402.1 OmpA family protein [Variovorax sp. J22G47]
MTTRRLGLCLTAACAVLLAACSTPATRVVLLPQEDGRPSAVVVQSKGGEQTLSKPYARATAAVGASGAPVVDQADPAQIRRDNKALFELVPPRAQNYALYFDAGGTALTPASEQTLQEVIATALARSGGDIVVTGHTDTTGTPSQNDELSRRRAQEIRQMLVTRGFPAARIEAVGRGLRDLAVPTGPDVDEPQNRRVTIEVR